MMADNTPETENPAMTMRGFAPVTKTPGVLVLGLGNILLTDEGAGVHVIRHLEQTHPDRPDLTFMDGGTLSFSLAEAIAETDALIVVDTAALNAAPGTVKTFEGADMDHFIATGGRTSVHEVSLSDLMTISALEGLLPKRRALVGIQPQEFDWGDFPSPPIAAALPTAADAVMAIVARWSA